MKVVLSIIATLLCGEALAQIHLGPVGDPIEVDCYNCDDHHGLPGCLNHVHKCHRDEVCSIQYGSGRWPRIHCQRRDECFHATDHALRNCTGGGVEVHHNECQKCCTTTACVSDLTNLLKIEAATSDNLMCPGHCRANDLQACVDSARMCHEGQFCQISEDDHGVKGECKDDHEYNHCLDEQNRHQHECDGTDHHGPHHPKCIRGCCTTNNCVNAQFGGVMTTTPAPATTVAGATLWERLKGDCKDQLANNGCKDLVKTQDVCHDRLALDICPETCGLCDAINGSVCRDTVVNGGCADLQANSDVCNDKLAVFICPNTCKMCDELVNSIITSLVDGTSNATDVPPSILPPSANPSDYPTFNCNDLDTFNCGMLDGLCGTSFVQVVCPDQCMKCQQPIVTGSVTQQVTMMPTTTMAPPMTTGDDMTDAPTTQAPTMAPADNSSSVTAMPDQCADHLDGGMSCTDLAGVCTSVLALSVCPKYCGLC